MLLAHDLGTTGDKASLHEDDGTMVAAVTETYETDYGPGGHVEQDPQAWWDASCAATRHLLSQTDTSPDAVQAVSFSGQMMGATLLDADFAPVRPSMIWADTRSGDQADLITQTQPWDQAIPRHDRVRPDPDADPDAAASWPTLRMNGNPVFKWASYAMAKTAAEAMDAAGVQPEDLEVFVPHQANNRITDAMFRALKLGSDVVVARDIIKHGNTSAASIPLAIETLLTSGFGAGLVYAGQVITLP